MSKLKEFIVSKGYDFEPEKLDGKFHEYKTEKNKGWYAGTETERGVLFTWGDWRTGEKFSCTIGWSGTDRERDQAHTDLEQKYFEEKKEKQLQAQKIALRTWSETQNIGESPYLIRKNISGLGLCKTAFNSWGEADLLVPMVDLKGDLWNIQRIQPDGFKSFQEKARVEGLCHPFEPFDKTETWYVAEGYSTAASIYQALKNNIVGTLDLGVNVACSFSCANLVKVVQELCKQKQVKKIVVCADNDWMKANTPSGNAGLLAAQECAALDSRIVITWPKFNLEHPKHTDFNDLLCTEGIDSVSKQICLDRGSELGEALKPTASAGLEAAASGEPEVRELKKGKANPTELEIVEKLLQEIAEDVVTCGAKPYDLFRWTGTHWKNLSDWELALMTKRIVALSDGKFSQMKAESALRMLPSHLSFVPRNMHDAHPYAVNLKNGTFHILGGKGVPLRMEFKPHDKRGFLTNYIDVVYDPSATNQEFSNVIDRVTGNAADKAQRIRALKQMFGAAIAPIFPMIFMLYGVTNTGKSSVIKILMKLVQEENLSRLPPTMMKGGFEMETMLGKLINIDTDIDYHTVINDAVIKKISDRTKMPINRKGRKMVDAHIPAVHIWAGNEIPGTLDRGSGAMDKRWVFLHFDQVVAGLGEGGDYADFEHWVWDLGPSGVLNFALEGLKDLLECNGKYFDPPSSKVARGTWSKSNDRIAHFIEDLANGEVEGLKLLENQTDEGVERSQLWERFSSWHNDVFGARPKLGRNKFFELLKSRTFTVMLPKSPEIKGKSGTSDTENYHCVSWCTAFKRTNLGFVTLGVGVSVRGAVC